MTKKLEEKTVLVMEDEVDLRIFATRVLEMEGYRVLQAEDGQEGLELVRENREVDLVLLDLRMPRIDGWTVLSQLKSDPELSAIPVIVFSASAEPGQGKEALRMGAAGYLAKPVSAAGLRESVGCIFRKR